MGGYGHGLRQPNGLDWDLYPGEGVTFECNSVRQSLRDLASLGLAVCVFAWGLQYKLSLYHLPQAASQRIQQASSYLEMSNLESRTAHR